MSKAPLVIDVQKDYFPGGKFPLCNTDETLASTVQSIDCCSAVDRMIHLIALDALSTRVALAAAAAAVV